MLMLQLAEKLGLTLQGVRDMPASEVTLWLAYFRMKDKPEEKKEVSTVDKFKHMMQR